MPELPDLQVFSSNLQKKLAGKKVKKINIIKTDNLNVTVREIKNALENQELKNVKRVGKEIHMEFNNGNTLGLHLMLRGNFVLNQSEQVPAYAIIQLLFDDGTSLSLTDIMGKAVPALNPEPNDTPDALSEQVTASFLGKLLKKARGSIKKVLLDQKKIRGIGNAYADEILWQAKISPMSDAGKIPEEKVNQLAESIKQVLRKAEKEIIKNDPDRISGEYRDFLSVHTSKKSHTPTGREIKVTDMGGRKTYYSDEQEMFT